LLLEVKDLQLTIHKFGKKTKILDGITLSVNKGETLGIVGESGCGKSITSLSIMKLLPENTTLEGSIELAGETISKYSKKQMEKIRGNQISMIFQEPLTSLNPLHTIAKQIEESLLLHTKLNKKERRARALDLLKEVGLPRAEEIVNEYPHQLSGGMRQRVMIAIAMACSPQLLICDEPTTALDVTVQAQILDLMNKLKKENDMSIMMITHDLGVVAEVCDRVVVMYAGRVVEEATVEEIFANPKHPYTQGLLNSIPRLGAKKQRLGSIPGTVPSPDDMPVGCRFADRCSEVMEVCRNHSPQFIEVGRQHYSACWLYDSKEAKANDAS
jgi:peptide/nickel transport system ATP-binding protein